MIVVEEDAKESDAELDHQQFRITANTENPN